MLKIIACLLLGCAIFSTVAPAYAEAVTPEPVTESEDAELAAQQAEDAPELAHIAGGNGLVVVLAAVGLIFIVLVIAGALN